MSASVVPSYIVAVSSFGDVVNAIGGSGYNYSKKIVGDWSSINYLAYWLY